MLRNSGHPPAIGVASQLAIVRPPRVGGLDDAAEPQGALVTATKGVDQRNPAEAGPVAPCAPVAPSSATASAQLRPLRCNGRSAKGDGRTWGSPPVLAEMTWGPGPPPRRLRTPATCCYRRSPSRGTRSGGNRSPIFIWWSPRASFALPVQAISKARSPSSGSSTPTLLLNTRLMVGGRPLESTPGPSVPSPSLESTHRPLPA